jgi:hypothetical protein
MSTSAPEQLPWPDAAIALRDELMRRPGRLALTVGDTAAALLSTIGTALGVDVSSVGKRLTAEAAPPNPLGIHESLNDMTLLADIDILFAPQMRTNPLKLLWSLGREAPRIAAWPGEIRDGRATYSTPNRPDYFDERLEDAIVLRARPQPLPSDLPFSIERITA